MWRWPAPARGRLRDGGWIEDAADDEGKHEIMTAVALGTDQLIEADPPGGSEGGGDVAVRQRAINADRLLGSGDDGAAFQQATQAFDVLLRPGREVAKCPLSNFAVLAIAFAKRDGGW